MATYQRAAAVLVALKREVVEGTVEATVTGAFQLRINDSPGLELKRAPIRSAEKRADMIRNGVRLGFKTVDGSYNCELAAGQPNDSLFEGIMRSTFVAAVSIGFASMTTITVGTNQVVAAGGDWVGSQGIRVGDIFTLGSYSTTANNNLNARVVAVTSLTITTATNTFTAGAADATGTLTLLKKVKSATTPTRYTYAIEQNDTDIDLSERFDGCRLVGFNLSCRPGAMAMLTYTFIGMDRTVLTGGTSPWFTTPALTTTLGMIADDCAIRNSATGDVTIFNSFDLNFTIDAAGMPVLGSFITPGTFDNDMGVSASVSGLRSDFAQLTSFDAETEFELSIMLQDAATAPKNCYAFFLPRCKITALSAPVGGGDGAKIQTLQIDTLPKVAATGYDAGICTISSSVA